MKAIIKEHKFDEDISYIAPSWEEMGDLIFELGKQIIESGKKYDLIVSIAKGGWTWTRALADILNMDQICSVKTKLYTGVGRQSKELTFEQKLPTGIKIKDKSILLHDDVADSGKTLTAVKKYLEKQGAKSVDAASLFYKPTSSFTPMFYAYKTTAWIVFPHELREFITETYIRWMTAKVKENEISKRFSQLNLPIKQIAFFLKTDGKIEL